jgi:hypothetical protein
MFAVLSEYGFHQKNKAGDAMARDAVPLMYVLPNKLH